jgi:aldose 1-epimerase
MELRSGAQHLVWDPSTGGRLISWQVHGHELLARHSDHPVEYGMYPMAPWAGRVRGNTITAESVERMGLSPRGSIELPINHDPWALHGTCFTAPVDAMTMEGSTVVSRQQVPKWPWRAELVNTWTIHDDGFDITTTLSSETPCPVILGWHPWFRRDIDGAAGRWSAASARFSRRSEAMPTDEWIELSDSTGPYDDVFLCPEKCVDITWPDLMSMSIRSSHPWFVIYDQLPDAFCVEPQTQIPNAWNEPIAGESDLAEPGSDITLATQWRWRIP